jgi:hypothetical protein
MTRRKLKTSGFQNIKTKDMFEVSRRKTNTPSPPSETSQKIIKHPKIQEES